MNFDLEYLKRDLRLNLFILFYSLFAKEINENSVRQEEKKEKSTNATKKKKYCTSVRLITVIVYVQLDIHKIERSFE